MKNYIRDIKQAQAGEVIVQIVSVGEGGKRTVLNGLSCPGDMDLNFILEDLYNVQRCDAVGLDGRLVGQTILPFLMSLKRTLDRDEFQPTKEQEVYRSVADYLGRISAGSK